jgi:hypothetical protein
MTRNLDFFCRDCYTSLVVIDDEWAQLLGPGDGSPRFIPVSHCRKARATEPLTAQMRATKPMGAIAS